MDYVNKAKPQNQTHFSEKVNFVKNIQHNSDLDIDKKEITVDNYNNRSVLKQKYPETQLKNISINFGFPNTLNSYDYQNSYDLVENPIFEQRNYFYYDKNFQLFKNKSVSRYGDKKFKNGNSTYEKYKKQNRLFSPQHKIITSIKKKKFLDEDSQIESNQKQKKDNKEIDVYELAVINQVLYNEEDLEKKSKKSGKETSSSKSGKESENENEWGEIEQAVFDDKRRNGDNNLLNSLCIEIEKENGDKQLKYVEISKDENAPCEDPCLKIKYTLEDKICLNCTTPDKNNKMLKTQTDSTINKKYLFNKNTASTYGTNTNGSLKRENVSEVYLKESKSNQNILSVDDNNDKIFFSGSTIPSSQKYSKYSNAMNNLNVKKKIDEINPINYEFKEEEENQKKIIIENKNIKNEQKENNLTKRIIGQSQEKININEVKTNTNTNQNQISNLKYNRASYDSKANQKRNYLIETKEQITEKQPARDLSIENTNKNTTQKEERKKIYEKYKKKQENEKIKIEKEKEKEKEKEQETDMPRINKRTYVRHKEENEDEDSNTFRQKITKKENGKDVINISTKKYETNTDKVNSGKYRFIQNEKKTVEESRNKSEDKYKYNIGNKNDADKKEKDKDKEKIEREKLRKEKEEKDRIEKLKRQNEEKERLEKERKERERLQKIEQEKREREKQEKERQQKLEKERQERERLQRIEQDKREKERQEKERQQKLERERQEKERQQKLEREKRKTAKIRKRKTRKRTTIKIRKRKTRKRKTTKIRKRKTAKTRERKTRKRKATNIREGKN